jgi:hypothetical protein
MSWRSQQDSNLKSVTQIAPTPEHANEGTVAVAAVATGRDEKLTQENEIGTGAGTQAQLVRTAKPFKSEDPMQSYRKQGPQARWPWLTTVVLLTVMGDFSDIAGLSSPFMEEGGSSRAASKVYPTHLGMVRLEGAARFLKPEKPSRRSWPLRPRQLGRRSLAASRGDPLRAQVGRAAAAD